MNNLPRIACAFLLSLASCMAFAQEFSKINLPNAVVMQPKVSYDGTQLVFMADYDGRQKPYITQYETDSARWSDPTLLFDAATNGQIEFQHPQLNFDNTQLLIAGRTIGGTDFNI